MGAEVGEKKSGGPKRILQASLSATSKLELFLKHFQKNVIISFSNFGKELKIPRRTLANLFPVLKKRKVGKGGKEANEKLGV